jgi:dienelactone hydrolase
MLVKFDRIKVVACLFSILISLCVTSLHAEPGQVARARFQATDSEQARTDANTDTQAVLDQIAWETGDFEVRCTSTPGLAYDALVRFDSPMPSGEQWVDEVVLMWYAARGEDGEAVEAPAVLMVHSLHPQMVIANQIARTFAKQGLHTFVLQLPGYGHRWEGRRQYPGVTALERGRQGVADCLRARDAIAVLPNIKPGPIALQGTSLGGFVAATVGGIEPAFDPVILLISGGDCYGALTNGQYDAMYLRMALERKGYRGDSLRALLEPVEPLHVAHRLNPDRTWLITARDDMTIPRASSDALAEAIGLDEDHRGWLNSNHYTSLVLLPTVSKYMTDIILGETPEQVTLPSELPHAAEQP